MAQKLVKMGLLMTDHEFDFSLATRINLSGRMLFPTATSDYQKNRWAYSAAIRHKQFYALACESQEQYERALAQGRHPEPREKTNARAIELVPHGPVEDGIVHILAASNELKDIFAPAPMVIHEEAEEASLKGQLAGAILVYVFHMRKFKMELPNLPNAYEVCWQRKQEVYRSKIGAPRKGQKGSALKGVSKESLEPIWGAYRSVAHWWAAYVTLDNISLRRTQSPLDKFDTLEMIRRAKLFAKFGSKNFTPSPNKSTLLKTPDLEWPNGLDYKENIDIDDTAILKKETAQYIRKALGFPEL